MRHALKRVLPLAAITAAALPAQQFQFSVYPVRPPASFVPVHNAVVGGFGVGDFDGDGRRDVFVCETFGGSVHLATGVRLPLPDTLAAQRPRLSDLDGDGDPDVVLLKSSYVLKILRNDTNAFVDVPLPAPVAGAALVAAAIGDVDSDGDGDLVVSCSGQPLVLLRNDGAMHFTADATVFPPLGAVAQFPALVDFDGDGALDVLAPTLPTGCRLLRNNSGTFVDASSQLRAIRSGAREMSVGDFDRDGNADVAMLVDGDLDVLWGTGSSFTLQPALVTPGASTLDVVDFDGDGDLDLVSGASSVQLIQNLGGRQFAPTPIVNEPVNAFGVGDVDGDGRQDVLFATIAVARIVRFWRGGAGEIRDAPFALGGRWPTGSVRKSTPFAGDVDGDGRSDLLIPTTSGLVVDHARGDGSYSVTVSADPSSSFLGPEMPYLADLDRDGDLDLVLAESVALRAYRNDGGGSFTRVLDVPMTITGVDDTRLGDVDGDGDLDLVRITAFNVLLVRNLGNWTFAFPQVIASGSPAHPAVDLLDVDGDGDLDVVCNIPRAGGGHTILANDGGGAFAPTSAFAIDVGTSAISLAHFDMDADGDQDLFVGSSPNPGPKRLLRNDGTGVFTDVSATHLPQSPIPALASTVLCADFDADGDVDVFMLASQAIQQGRLLANDGTGHFADVSVSRVGPFDAAGAYWKLVAADIDDDGDLDILMGGNSFLGRDTQVVLVNNLRHLRTAIPARIGDLAEFTISSGPGFGPTGAAVLAVSFARASAPILLPGFIGSIQLEPAAAQIAAVEPISLVGISSVFVPVPASLPLVGQEAWLQAAIVPTNGMPGLTNALYEVVLR